MSYLCLLLSSANYKSQVDMISFPHSGMDGLCIGTDVYFIAVRSSRTCSPIVLGRVGIGNLVTNLQFLLFCSGVKRSENIF